MRGVSHGSSGGKLGMRGVAGERLGWCKENWRSVVGGGDGSSKGVVDRFVLAFEWKECVGGV